MCNGSFSLWYSCAVFENTRIIEFDKNANSFYASIKLIMRRISLATIGVCIFYAAASVVAFFIVIFKASIKIFCPTFL